MSEMNPADIARTITAAAVEAVTGDGKQKPKAKLLDERLARVRAQTYGKGLPDVVIRLGAPYAFDIVRAGENTTVVPASTELISQSYLAEQLVAWNDVPIRVELAPRVTMDLPPGVTIVMGKSGAGKTALTLGRIAALNENVLYVRHGEPVDSYLMRLAPRIGPGPSEPNESGVELAMTEAWLAQRVASIVAAGASDMNVMIIDSLRHVVFGSSGNTGKGGVNMTLFSDLSYLDVVAAARGIALIVIINPMTDDPAAYELLLEVASGSVAGVIDVKSPSEIRSISRYDNRRWRNTSLPTLASKGPSDAAQRLTRVTPGVADLGRLVK